MCSSVVGIGLLHISQWSIEALDPFILKKTKVEY